MSTPSAHAPADARQRTTQLALATVAFAISFAVWGLLGALAPLLRKELGLNQTQASVLVAIPVILGSVGRLPLGILTERFGGRRVMTVLLAFAAIPAAGVALSHSYGALLAWAFLLGLAGSSFAVGVAFTSKWFPPEAQGTALGVFGAGNIGQSLAVFFAPRLARALGVWPPVVLGFGLVSLAFAIVFWAFARDARPGKPRPLADSLRVLATAPTAWLLSLFYFLTFGGFVAMGVYLPTLLTSRYGLTLEDAGLRTAGFVVLATAARPIGGWLADRVGGARVLLVVFTAVILAATALIPASFTAFTVGALGFAVTVGIGNGAVFKLVPQFFPTETGTVTGLVGAFGGLGGFFPPLVLGALVDATGSYTFGFVALAVVAAVCLAFTANLVRRPAASATR